jgi:hypothetical protein
MSMKWFLYPCIYIFFIIAQQNYKFRVKCTTICIGSVMIDVMVDVNQKVRMSYFHFFFYVLFVKHLNIFVQLRRGCF